MRQDLQNSQDSSHPEHPVHPVKKTVPLYRRKPPKPVAAAKSNLGHEPHAVPFITAPFRLREDGTIQLASHSVLVEEVETPPPKLIYPPEDRLHEKPFIRIYHGNCLDLLDEIYRKYGEAGRFAAIFADPPYFLSNGGITCHAGKMVKVDKGYWDVSRGPELNHEFNTEWLRRCQRVLKPNGTIWVTGTHHVIFSIGYALQQLGFKILNDIAWEKPNPPPNLSCRYFTHSTETILWAAKDAKSKHVFNYQEMRKVTGKQMKTVWRDVGGQMSDVRSQKSENAEPAALTSDLRPQTSGSDLRPPISDLWTISAPGSDEKEHGKHPTQKPVALVERCLVASTNEGDLVLDPFLGNGTTAVAAVRTKRGCVGVEADLAYISVAAKRIDREIIEIWLRHFRVRIDISVTGRAGTPLSAALPRPRERERMPRGQVRDEWEKPSDRRARSDAPYQQIDLAIFSDSINGSRDMAGVPEIQTERIFHESKFVFLSCAHVERGAVVHTTVDVSLQEAWAKTPTGKKRETTHIVRCETEIFRVKSG